MTKYIPLVGGELYDTEAGKVVPPGEIPTDDIGPLVSELTQLAMDIQRQPDMAVSAAEALFAIFDDLQPPGWPDKYQEAARDAIQKIAGGRGMTLDEALAQLKEKARRGKEQHQEEVDRMWDNALRRANDDNDTASTT